MSRTTNTLRNLKTATIGQALGMLISFVSRKIFVMMLPTEYLGLSGLFTNILSILALSELGFGTAIVYSLYKPLAENDYEKIKSLMRLFKKVYTAIGVFILVVGISLTPFLKFFINDMPDIPDSLSVIYIMYVVNSAASYFFIYKRSLIIADQKRYIATIYRYGLFVILNIAQSIALILTRNFYLYLALLIANTVLENVLVSIKADKLFPYIKEKDVKPLDKEVVSEIKKNVFAMMCHKIGGVVVNGTSNLLISKLVSLVAVGLYSNYMLVINALNSVMGLIFQSITASFGNLSAESTKEKKEEVFDTINFATFWIAGVCSVMLTVMFEPFIEVWLGKEYLCGIWVVLMIVLNFFLRTMRQPVLMTRDAMGLFWYDRYKPLFESVINLIAAIILGKKYGIIGVLSGSAISTLCVNLWIEPWVLYKYGFESKLRKYFKDYLIYFAQTVVCLVITYFVSSFIVSGNFLWLIVKAIVAVFVCNLVFVIFNIRSNHIKKYMGLVLKMFKKEKTN